MREKNKGRTVRERTVREKNRGRVRAVRERGIFKYYGRYLRIRERNSHNYRNRDITLYVICSLSLPHSALSHSALSHSALSLSLCSLSLSFALVFTHQPTHQDHIYIYKCVYVIEYRHVCLSQPLLSTTSLPPSPAPSCSLVLPRAPSCSLALSITTRYEGVRNSC